MQNALGSVDHEAIIPVLPHHADLALDGRVKKRIARSPGNRQAQVGAALSQRWPSQQSADSDDCKKKQKLSLSQCAHQCR